MKWFCMHPQYILVMKVTGHSRSVNLVPELSPLGNARHGPDVYWSLGVWWPFYTARWPFWPLCCFARRGCLLSCLRLDGLSTGGAYRGLISAAGRHCACLQYTKCIDWGCCVLAVIHTWPVWWGFVGWRSVWFVAQWLTSLHMECCVVSAPCTWSLAGWCVVCFDRPTPKRTWSSVSHGLS